tara:strand:+ start:4259 stop:4978 length:720 start_codon:yes stop_codon:yes gene_type:complete
MTGEKHGVGEQLEHLEWALPWLGYVVHLDTFMMTGIVIGFLGVILFLLMRNLHDGAPTGLQNFMEVVVEFIENLVKENLPVYVSWVTPLALTLFIFILLGNWLGEIPGMHSPTADINTTVSLGLISFTLLLYFSLKHKGFGYFSEFLFHPFGKWFIPVNLFMKIVEEVAKPASLSLRLFGNMFAGHVVILLIAYMLPWYLNWTVGLVWLGWHLFVGLIQAFVFTILTVVYIAIGQQKEH